ncbi:MAG: PorT family protein [Prevotella sp.]|jgi:hypothetical protein|nr:PorT family protein [Prevotella sp.]
MANRFIILLLSGLVIVAANGQDEKFQPEWNVGAGFGPAFSSVSFEPNSALSLGGKISTENIRQYSGGFAVRYITEKKLGLIAELNYSRQGWEQYFEPNQSGEASPYQHSHQLNYLELPVLTHIYFGNKVRFFVNLGPKISFLISDGEKMNRALSDELASGNMPASFVTHQYYRMAEKKIDYGLMGGMGLEFRTDVGHFALEGRYTFGLGDIYNNRKSDFFNRSANRVISAKLTYYVKLF